MKIEASHEDVKNAFNDCYNKLYLQNRVEGRERTDEEWEFLVAQANHLLKRSEFERKIVNIVMEFFEKDEKLTSQEETKKAFWDVYNKFYNPNRLEKRRVRPDEEWEFIVDQAETMAKHSMLARKLIAAILGVFEKDEEIAKRGA